MKSNITILDGTLSQSQNPESAAQSTSLCGGVFEMESEFMPDANDQRKKTKFQVNQANEGLTFEDQKMFTEAHEPRRSTKFEVSKTSAEDVFESPKIKIFSSSGSQSTTSSAESESPVLTLASSFKDSTSISRGFVIPDVPKEP